VAALLRGSCPRLVVLGFELGDVGVTDDDVIVDEGGGGFALVIDFDGVLSVPRDDSEHALKSIAPVARTAAAAVELRCFTSVLPPARGRLR
jgi:hypothetical protein